MPAYLFECSDCNKQYLPDDIEYLCPQCSSTQREMEPLSGIVRCIYDYPAIKRKLLPAVLRKRRERGLGRFAELIPIKSAHLLPPLITDITPLRPVPNLRSKLKLANLWLKDDTVMPTGSFKDRASALVVASARGLGRDTIVTASTGNAATALAGQAASVGLKCVIFVPSSAPVAKLTQIVVLGGRLIPIRGNYDEAFELSIKASKAFGWYNRNTAYNPFTIEGKKTAALEIWEQLGYSPPDWVIVPTGDGVILAGIEKGFGDLRACGLIDRVPRIAAVQAAGCAPIVRAFEQGSSIITPEPKPKTIADSIAVGVPRAGRLVLKALRSCNGVAVRVADDEIVAAISLIGRTTGIFAEPAAAAAIAGLKKLAENGTIAEDATVVALITGNGLKDIAAASRVVDIPKAIDVDIDEVRTFLQTPLPKIFL